MPSCSNTNSFEITEYEPVLVMCALLFSSQSFDSWVLLLRNVKVDSSLSIVKSRSYTKAAEGLFSKTDVFRMPQIHSSDLL